VDECASDPDYDRDCADDVQRNQSFLSGHTAMSFTGAGLICVEHANLALYGGGSPGVEISCVRASAFPASNRPKCHRSRTKTSSQRLSSK